MKKLDIEYHLDQILMRLESYKEKIDIEKPKEILSILKEIRYHEKQLEEMAEDKQHEIFLKESEEYLRD